MTRLKQRLARGVALWMALFHLYAGYFGQPEAQLFRSTHVAFVLVLLLLVFPSSKQLCRRAPRVHDALDLGLVAGVVAIQAYILRDPQGLWLRTGQLTPVDLTVATLYLLILVEATRRAVGLAMVGVAVFFVLNAVYGDWFPWIFYGPPHPWRAVLDALFLGDDGVFGIPVDAAASYIVLFIIFGALLKQSRALDFFMKLALALTGRQIGGTAKAAVLGSAFVGTFTGSAVANVVGCGSITIPLMKRSGYPAHFAAGVEAVSSSGGQIMPPVMGVTAFILAEIVGVSYWKVASAAAIPAILYFLSIYFMVDFEARKRGMERVPRAERPPLGGVLREGGYLLLPIALVFYLLFAGYSVQHAATWAIAAVLGISFLSRRTRLTPRDVLDALDESSRNVVPVSMACAAAGLIIGAVFMAGVGNRFSELVLTAAGGRLWLALLLTMCASFILGMGLTTTADYIILATLVIPALIRMGAQPLPAHLFAFYFSSISGITPPVALASFAAAAIARAGLWETGITAVRVGIAAFAVPYLFVYSPELTLQGGVWGIGLSAARAALSVLCLAAATEGWLARRAGPVERLGLLGAAVLFVWPTLWADALALLTVASVLVFQLSRPSREARMWKPVRERGPSLGERWPLRSVRRIVQSEIERESGAASASGEAFGGMAAGYQQSVVGWVILVAVTLGFTWVGVHNVQVLAFNTFLSITLALAIGTLVLVPRV